jgi:hypothetical protein
LQCLALLLRFHQVAIDPAQIDHQFSGVPAGVSEMLRCAKKLKLKARVLTESWAGLMKLPLPAIIELKDKIFIIVGKVTAGDALVQVPSENRPQIVKRAEFDYDWTGRVVLMGKVVSVSQDAIVRDKANAKRPVEHCPIRASPTDRNFFIRRGYRWIRRKCKSKTKWSVSHRVWRQTVEIRTGTRRLIEYLMAPALRYKHESMRER